MTTMKKICHMTSTPQYHIPRLIKECKSILKIGYVPYIVSQGETFIQDGIYYIGINSNKTGRLSRMFFTSHAIYKVALELNADIYQIHDPELLPYSKKLKRKGKVVVFDSHEFYGEQIKEKQYIPSFLRKFISYVYMRYEEHVCKRIDATLAVCTLSGSDYFHERTKKTVFISNAVVLNNFTPSYDIPFEKRIYFAHVGALTHDRGITHLIRAAAKTKAKLVLVGKYISSDYQSELGKMPEYKCVEYRGFLSESEVVDVLNGCIAGIATLLNIGQYHKVDTLATKVYEYMSMGLPVIISRYPYAEKLNNKYNFGICVNPEDIDEISNAINFLMDNPGVAREMGQNGRKLILEELNWAIEEEKLLKLYNDLV